jgi:HEAT repeat protein
MSSPNLKAIIEKLRVEETRWDAILDLKLLQMPKMVTALVPYLEDPEWVIRWCIAEKLGDLMDPSAIKWLCKLLQDEDFHVRKNAVKALLRFGPDMVAQLVDYLPHPNIFVRRHVYAIIMHFGRHAIPHLEAQATTSKDWLVLHRILHTLYALGGVKAEAALCHALKHKDHQKEIILLLGNMRCEKAVPAMIKLYKEPKLRRCILASVAQVGYKSAVPTIISALATGTPAIKTSAESMILKIGPACLPHLLKAILSDGMPYAKLLGLVEKLGPEPALPSIHRLADRNDVFKERTKAFRKAHPLPENSKRLGGLMNFLGDIGDALLR